MKNTIIILGLCLITIISVAQKSNSDAGRMNKMWGETKVTSQKSLEERARLFADGNFGMFIHWGLYSHLGGKWKGKTYYGIGEWIMNKNMAGIPVQEYKQVAKEFNPVDFDAKAIAQLAKDAGMKYIIITSKHHDGFAMFHSKANAFNIVDATPFNRDPMKELAAACHELGLGFGFYYSHYQDWTAPGGAGGPNTFPDGKPATFDDYFYQKCLPQVKEFCSNYGKIDFIWFDTPGSMKKERVRELVAVVKELQPEALLNSRVGQGMGDYASEGDMDVPKRNIDGLWETPDTNNDSWSYAWYDDNFKSPKEILRRLIATVGRGGTYLLNVGPDGKGNVPETGATFLRAAGKWIQKYPQVIYAAGSSPWEHALPWGDVTTKENSLFLSVFDWPKNGKLYLPGLQQNIISAKLLHENKSSEITVETQNGWTVLNVPCQPADNPVSVIEVQLEGNAQTIKVNKAPGIYPNIEVELLAEFAHVVNAEKKKISWMEKFGEWKHVNQVSKWGENSKAVWTVNVCQPGNYYLELCYKGKGRLVWKTTTDENVSVQNEQAATEKYVSYPMGILQFKTTGMHTISVSLVEGDNKTSSFKSVRIRPVEQN